MALTQRMLRCGTPLLVERMTGVASASLNWLLPAGSVADHDAFEGTSAMWEELLLRGAGQRSSRQHADDADRLGASRVSELGTYTLRVGTTCLGKSLHEVLPLIVDMVRQPHMDEESVKACLDLCVQAIEGLKDDPQERAMLLTRERHYPHPVHRTGMGTIAGLQACTREQLLASWQEHARPIGSIVCVAGDVDADAVAARFDELLEGWAGAAPVPRLAAVPARGYAHEQDPSEQVQIIVAYDGPPEPDASSMLEKLAVSVLSGGMSGRLFSEVREKRALCYSVNAGYRGDKEFGVVSAYVGTTPQRAQESLDVLMHELHRITTPEGRVTPEEFARAQIGMKSGLIFSGESTSARASALGQDWRRLGRARTLDEIAREVDAVSLDQLNAYLATRRFGRMTIQTLGPSALTPPVV
jgi:predicted Zn-dependent peptidase